MGLTYKVLPPGYAANTRKADSTHEKLPDAGVRRTIRRMQSIRILAVILALLSGTAPAEPSRDLLREQFEQSVRAIAAEVDGVVGVTLEDLATGERFSINGDVVFTQASAIKLPILIELFRQVERGRYDLDAEVRLEATDVVPGSGVLQQLTPGKVTLTLRDVATLMVTVSDNSATNMIIDRVGMERVNETMLALGLTETKLQRKMMDAGAWSENRENLSTPDEQSALLKILADTDSTFLSAASRDEILRILSIPKPSRIRPGLPPGTRVAHKTGSLDGVVVDVGIVFMEERAFIIAMMGNWLADAAQAEDAMSRIAGAAYGYFDRVASSNRYGHRK